MRPRGLPASWIKVSPTYWTGKKQPSRRAGLLAALALEEEDILRLGDDGKQSR
jgi:hypothetical protein